MTLSAPALFSVVTPVYDPPVDVLAATLASVRDQTYPEWELILVNDCSPNPAVGALLREFADSDMRVTLVELASNRGIAEASNVAIEKARGEFIVLLDHDDLLVAEALEKVADAIDANPDVDYLYTDEDKIDDDGRLFDKFEKPDWSPERFRHQMYTCHLSVLRTSLVRSVGSFHDGFDGSQDHDLVLRVTEQARQIIHIPEVLYHWRLVPGSAAAVADAKPYAWEAGRRAVQAHLDRTLPSARAEFGPHPGLYRVVRSAEQLPLVSIVIPTAGRGGMMWGEPRTFVVEAVRSALARTKHQNIEVVVVYDTSVSDAVLSELRDVAGDRLVLVPYDGLFNFSRKVNVGFLASSGEIVVLLNDDIEVAEDGWLEELVTPLDEPDIGMTGAKLLYSDGTLQHGGHVYARGGLFHAFTSVVPSLGIDFCALYANREVSGVTAACAALRRDVFEEVGGLTELLPTNFNDVDLSYKIASRGYRIVWAARSVLYHFESQSRPRTVEEAENAFISKRWGLSARDRYMPTA